MIYHRYTVEEDMWPFDVGLDGFMGDRRKGTEREVSIPQRHARPEWIKWGVHFRDQLTPNTITYLVTGQA
jgi:hypothetical protein